MFEDYKNNICPPHKREKEKNKEQHLEISNVNILVYFFQPFSINVSTHMYIYKILSLHC